MADHNENLKDTLNEEIEHADQKPAEEHYSLNDDFFFSNFSLPVSYDCSVMV